MNNEMEQKKIYEAPKMEEVELRQESYFLCGSSEDENDYHGEMG
jgi:hypothetical protein